MELRDSLELSTWRHAAGTLKPWVRIVLVLASIATVLLPFAGSRVLWYQDGDKSGVPCWLFENGLAIVALAGLVIAAYPRFALSRYVRLAVLLPIVHLVLVALAWPAWLAISGRLTTVREYYYLARAIPLSAIIAGEVAIVGTAAWWITRARRDTTASHAFVMIALVDLLLLGLWLPLVAWATTRGTWRIENDPSFTLAHPARLAAYIIAPPLAAAIAYSSITIGRSEIAKDYRSQYLGVIATLFVAAFLVRFDSVPSACVVYANFTHVLLGAMTVAATGPLVIGIAMWWRGRSLHHRLARDAGAIRGIVVRDDPDEPVIAVYEVATWLRPPRARVRSFVVATPTGQVPVSGARLIAPIDPATTALRVGESFGVLRAGDPITISSSRAPSRGGAPFRESAGPHVGADPVIAPYGVPGLTFSDLALALWRPTVAYLVILVAVAAPALAALAASPR
jgi:hypothetical protein